MLHVRSYCIFNVIGLMVIFQPIEISINQSVDKMCIAPLQLWTSALNSVKIYNRKTVKAK